jgi:hypothetical protein
LIRTFSAEVTEAPELQKLEYNGDCGLKPGMSGWCKKAELCRAMPVRSRQQAADEVSMNFKLSIKALYGYSCQPAPVSQ